MLVITCIFSIFFVFSLFTKQANAEDSQISAPSTHVIVKRIHSPKPDINPDINPWPSDSSTKKVALTEDPMVVFILLSFFISACGLCMLAKNKIFESYYISESKTNSRINQYKLLMVLISIMFVGLCFFSSTNKAGATNEDINSLESNISVTNQNITS
jgi:hypothetical protein